MNLQDGRATSRVRLKIFPAFAFFQRARSATMCCGSQMEPVDLGDKQEVVSSLDDAGELHTKSDKGEGGVGPYGVSGSLESSGERHTK